ncbi:hypothetical protein KC909_02380 [Candidatus Dojkabacteria bacterium]|uniref:Fibronectin type-III domain-containing protein n=1 Tax=Candidatus Dojkabacteria bacterium TaxID=2099670 RepID=A0A955RJ88_9BACT|nr:hypothetical protein [Candidatus Dojkabacteria bacterium]
MNRFISTFAVIFAFIVLPGTIYAQSNLDSTNYRILDPNVDAGGGQESSTSFSLIGSVNELSDSRLTSGSYELKAGFPNGILANVPVINCFETDTTSGTTNCNYFPNANGAQGECGNPGCYNRAKLEIDDQNNPIDTIYLVQITDTTNSVTYYLQSDHTLGTSYDINDFLTQCFLEGIDVDDTACDDSGDANWDEDLQRYNILGLLSETDYEVSVAALSGDFTGTRFSQVATTTTQVPSITFDLDIASADSESSAPYSVDIGEITTVSVATATDLIWIDLGTNSNNGSSVFVRDIAGQLLSPSTSETIPSESEDLASDPNANGGYGLKIQSVSENSLGPLQEGPVYSTTGSDEVGALSSINTLLVFTDTTGTNLGPISGGRASLAVKARSIVTDAAASDYSDEITFIAIGNF